MLIVARTSSGLCHRQLITCVLVALWGYRLTHNFVARGGIGHEDWRYADMRRQFGAHFWWISLFSVFLGQTLFLFAACLPLYADGGHFTWRLGEAYLPCTFPVPSLYLPCTLYADGGHFTLRLGEAGIAARRG